MAGLHQDKGYKVLKGYWPRGCESEGRWAGTVDFKAEYAKSNRSCCRLCGQTIDMGRTRMALMMVSIYGDVYKNCWWYHTKCFFKHREALKLLDVEKEVEGFSSLDAADKADIVAQQKQMQAKYSAESKIANSAKDNKLDDDDHGGSTSDPDYDSSSDDDDDDKPRKRQSKKAPAKKKQATTKKAKKEVPRKAGKKKK